MISLKNLSYKIERFFMGESGIVEKIREYPIDNKKTNPDNGDSLKDSFGNLPQIVIFKNSLGETKEEIVYLFEKIKSEPPTFVYKLYKPGDKYP